MGNLEIGSKAIGFCLPDENKEEVCLNDFLGKWVILYFYPKDNTSGCTLEAIDFSKEVESLKKMNTEIIGVSPDSPKSHCNFIDKHDLKVKLLSDSNHEVLEKYGVWVMKKMYGKSYYGVERSTFIVDPVGNIVYLWRKLKVPGHIENVKEKLKEYQSK